MRGGALAPCDRVSTFYLSSASRFVRVAGLSPKDCFINILQLLGFLDENSANIMRISAAGRTGFTKEEIEKVFILLLRYNFEFVSIKDYWTWLGLASVIKPGEVAFVGAGNADGGSHVFLIGKSHDLSLFIIDPTVNKYCKIGEPCQLEFLPPTTTSLYILKHSELQIPLEDLQKIFVTI